MNCKRQCLYRSEIPVCLTRAESVSRYYAPPKWVHLAFLSFAPENKQQTNLFKSPADCADWGIELQIYPFPAQKQRLPVGNCKTAFFVPGNLITSAGGWKSRDETDTLKF